MTGRQIHTTDLAFKSVDPSSPVPLYHQIEANLRELILSGELSPDDILPPEMELCRVYSVGRHTIRTALSRLAADNLIVRKAGRGTVVVPRADRMKFYLDRSFTRQMADMGRAAHSRTLHISTGTIERGAPKALQGKVGSACLHLSRLRYGDEEPIGLQYSVIITDLCPGLEAFNFDENSLYEVLSTHYHLVIHQITHTVTAAVANRTQAELLEIFEGDPLLVVATTAYLAHHQVIEYTTSYYRADRYEYSTTYRVEG